MTDLSQRIASLSPAKRKLLDRLSSNEKNAGAPVAVVGMSCHFPGAPTIDEYWKLIAEGRNLSEVVPQERWDVDVLYDPSPDTPGRTAAKWACLIDDVDRFDPVFFGIAPREASRMDPQQRLLLHCCWEAMEHAAIDPKLLSRSPTGVFIGVGQTDYSRVIAQYDNSLQHVDAHCGTGGALSICANRLSYIFNFTGPSVAVDTACSSGLVAVHQAVTSLRRGECESAIAGGVNVCLTGDSFITLSKARMLSPTGACRPFDSRANGYVRGEGCGVVLLKRLSDAVRDGDRVLAIVRGSAVNHSGRTSGITAPSGLAQQRVIRAALADGGVQPDQVEYVEAHGTGTPLGDPIEVEALSEVFTANGSKTLPPVYLTSVKANIGHTEIAAGMAGMIKTILMMRNGVIPSQIEIEELNPHLRMEGSRIRIPQESIQWESPSPRFAGVSSFGFGGTNSHVVLQSAADPPESQNGSAGRSIAGAVSTDRVKSNGKTTADKQAPMLLPLSARTKRALQNLAESFRELVSDVSDSQLADVCHTAGIGRGHFDLRAAIIADDREDLISGLERLAGDRRGANLRKGRRRGSARPSIAAMFTGQGSQYVNMGMGLYHSQPVFRSAMDRCNEIIRELRGQSVLSVIRGEIENESVDETRWTQPALFALEYSLASLWKSWGIEPDYLIGHSVGEYVAATVADVFDLETGLQLICKRGDLMQSLPAGGSMAVVFATGSDVEGWLSNHTIALTIAAYNGPGNTTIAGKETAIKRAVAEFEKAGVSAQLLEVSHAFHSPLMDGILDEFEGFASGFEFRAPQIPIISNLTGSIETDAVFTSKYWRDHIRNPVRFAQGVARLSEKKVDCLVEMGPSTALLGMARRCDPELAMIAVGSLKRGGDERCFAIQSLADLYTVGVDPDWNGIDHGRRVERIDLPGYPFDTDKYWFQPEYATTRFRDFIMSSSHVSPTLGSRLLHPTNIVFESRLTPFLPKHLGHHRVLGDIVVPGSAYAEMALSAARVVFDQEWVSLENLNFSKAMFLSECPRVVQTHVVGPSADRKRIQIFSRPVDADDNEPWDLNATCSIVSAERPRPAEVDAADVKSRAEIEIEGKEFYDLVAIRGLDYGDAFRVIGKMWRCPSEVYCEANLDDTVQADRHRFSIHPAIGDGCMQAMTGAVPLEVDGSFCPDLYLPISVKRVTVFGSIGPDESDTEDCDADVTVKSVDAEIRPGDTPVDDSSKVSYYVKRTSEITGPSPDWVEADVWMFDNQGEVISFWEGVRVQRVSEKSKEHAESPDQWLYEVQWKTMVPGIPAEDGATEDADQNDARPLGSVLIFADGHGFTESLVQTLVADQSAGKPDLVEMVAIGDPDASQKTPLPGQIKRHQFADSGEAIESFRPLLKEWAADRPTDAAVNLVLCRGLDAEVPIDGRTDQIESAQQIWTETFRLLTDILVTTFPGRVAVWLVTQGARSVADDDVVNPNQSPLVGLGQVASLELRRQSVRQVDLDPSQSHTENVDRFVSLLKQGGPEMAIAIRQNKTLVPRLERTQSMATGDHFSATVPTDSPYRLRLGNNDTIDSLRFERKTRRRPQRDEVEVEVRAAGLNFSDVLKAIGLYPGITDDVVPLGLECSGVVSAMGPDVKEFKVGDEVVGIVPHGFASHCITSEVGLVAKPSTLDHEEAAVVPVAFLTAYYCLKTVARLQPGERVLIHAGAGGVGLAAIQIAQEIGAEIFATAGSDEKRDFLRAIGVQHVMNSRSLAFAEQIDEITDGKGVDVVLNSLPGDAIDKSIESLAPYGRFVEIGKTDIYANKPLSLSPFQDNLSYSAVDLDRLFRQRPQVARDLMNEVMERFEQGTYEPSHSTLFPIQEVIGAFRFMSQRKNIGKVVVSVEPLDRELATLEFAEQPSSGAEKSTIIRPDGSYWITGGLGALGLATARWLTERGAGGVVLMSRREPDEDQRSKIDQLADSGTKIHVVSGDVCDLDSLTAAMASLPTEMPPIRGVLHAAGVLRDKWMAEMSDEDFQFPLAPKTRGTWNLHLATARLELDFFVLFSSVSSVLGTAGQSNYGAANSFLDGFAEFRTKLGKPTVAINWGAFSGSGMAEALAETMESKGVQLLPVQECLDLIEPIVQSAQPRATVFRADWNRFGGLLRSSMTGELQFGLIEDLAGDADETAGVDTEVAEAIRDELRLLAPDQMQVRLQTFFAKQLSEIMGIEPEDIDPQATLTSLGLDSLMAIELGNKMQLSLQIELPMSVYLEGPTIENLAGFVRGVLCKELGLEDAKDDTETESSDPDVAFDDESAVRSTQS